VDEADPVLITALGNHALWMVNTGDEAGRALAESYGVGGIPAFVLMNEDEEIFDRWGGFGGAEKWSERFAEASAVTLPVAEREERFAAAPTVEDALFLGRFADESGDFARAIDLFTRALAIDSAAAREGDAVHDRFAAAFFGAMQGELPMEEAGPVIEAALRDPETKEKSVMAFARLVFFGVRMMGLEPLEPYIRIAHPRIAAYEGEEHADEKKEFLLEYAVRIEKDVERGLAMKREMLPEGWEKDAEELNDFAWWCYVNDINLEEAEALARRGAELAEEDAVRANIIDTVAEIVNLRGDPVEAVRLMEQAVELDTSSVYLRSQLDRFRAIRDGKVEEG